MAATLQRNRSGMDIILGILLVIGGIFLLSNAVLATAISVLVIAWTVLFSGLVMLIIAVMSLRSGISWSTVIGGAILAVLGVFILRSPLASAFALTIMAGAMFFASGLMRITLAFTMSSHRWLFIFSGLVSIFLALWIIANPAAATLKLLGILLSVQVISEGSRCSSPAGCSS